MPAHTHRTLPSPQPPVTAPVLKVKTRIRAGGLPQNQNERLVKTSPPMKDLHVKTRIKAGSIVVRD